MRAKRAKQYRKLMQQYALTFGFREPYQVIVDAELLQDADRFKMNLTKSLESTLLCKVKPMITQCSIRHLYNATPKNEALIEQAKTYERRRCGHHTLDQPLSTIECLGAVVDPKEQNENKFRYIVASQDEQVRSKMRSIPGVPLIYIKRSIMILEPMAGATEEVQSRSERGKFRAGVAKLTGRGSILGKRQREGNDEDKAEDAQVNGDTDGSSLRRKKRGPKGPNPLSMKKPKVRESRGVAQREMASAKGQVSENGEGGSVKKKRKRTHKPKTDQESDGISFAAQRETSAG